MVYLSLSVNNLNQAIDFYSKVMRIFDSMAESRLVCNSGVDLIIDVYEIGSKSHKEIFSVENHSPSNIAIHHGEGIKIKIKEHLKLCGIKYKFSGNLAGERLSLQDPSGNKIAIWANHGGIV